LGIVQFLLFTIKTSFVSGLSAIFVFRSLIQENADEQNTLENFWLEPKHVWQAPSF